MPKAVSLFRVFIASPGDCTAERRIARQVITDWNITSGYSSGVMLEAVLWESHAYPEYGPQPQEVINKQILNSCDVLVAIFKTRLGSPTNVGISGTVEEIERFHSSGKPVLLYFSEQMKGKKTDSDQLAALLAFKSRMEGKGLFGTYRGKHEFQMKLSVHLALSMSKISGVSLIESTEIEPVLKPSSTFSSHFFFPGAQPVAKKAASTYIGNPKSALRYIRDNTSYLWPDLMEINPWELETKSEKRESTFEKIKPALNALVAGGYLQYELADSYKLSCGDMLSWQENDDPVVPITVSSVTKDLVTLILEVGQEYSNEYVI